MGEVSCLYCGERVEDDRAECPHCGAPSHFQRRGNGRASRRRFVLLFGLLAAIVIAMAFWLPR